MELEKDKLGVVGETLNIIENDDLTPEKVNELDGQIIETTDAEGHVQKYKITVAEREATPEELAKAGDVPDQSEEDDNIAQESVFDVKKMIEEDNTMSADEKRMMEKLLLNDQGELDIKLDQVNTEALKFSLAQVFKSEENKKILPYIYTTNEEEIKIKSNMYSIEIDTIKYYLKDEFKELVEESEGDEVYPFYQISYKKLEDKFKDIPDILDKDNKVINKELYGELLYAYSQINKVLGEEYSEILRKKAWKTHINQLIPVTTGVLMDFEKLMSEIDEKKKYKDPDILGRKRLYDSFIKKSHRKEVNPDLLNTFLNLLENGAWIMVLAYEIGVNEVEDYKVILEKINDGTYENKWLFRKCKHAFFKYLDNTYRANPYLKGSVGCLENQINSNHLAGTQLLNNLVDIFKLSKTEEVDMIRKEMAFK